MEENCKVDLPINLNCWKHHATFIKKQIGTLKRTDELESLKSILLKIGESQMDLYYGKLSPAVICRQTIDFLKSNKILLLEAYKDWLCEGSKDYQLVKFSDESVWTIRLGEKVERYVHIHPGRYSPHTIRVKATSLKTLIFVLCFKQLGEFTYIDTETINQIRKKYLNEPPLKYLSKASGLIRLFDLFNKKL